MPGKKKSAVNLDPIGNNDPVTQLMLEDEGLSIDAPLGITTGGHVRHLTNSTWGKPTETLCNLFRSGTSLMRLSTLDDHQPLCQTCLKTLECEVMRGKEAMKNQPEESD